MSELIINLMKCEKFLLSVGEEFWSKKINEILKIMGDEVTPKLLNKVLTLYGGMGSFNDLIITRENGHFIKEFDEEKINEKLDVFRKNIYKEAVRLKKEYDKIG